jgi:hypothetical protein
MMLANKLINLSAGSLKQKPNGLILGITMMLGTNQTRKQIKPKAVPFLQMNRLQRMQMHITVPILMCLFIRKPLRLIINHES